MVSMNRIFLLLLLLTVVLSGCGGQEGTPAATEMKQTEIPTEAVNSEDTELNTLEVVLENGEVLTLSVLGKQAEVSDCWGIREIRVYRKEALIQTISMAEAIAKDGVDGIDTGYTESFSIENAAKLRDVDFDGNPDLEVCGWCPNNAIPYYYWLWDPETEQFQYGFSLQLQGVDAENRQLIAWYKVENGLYYTDYLRVNDQGEPELIKREIEDVRPK